MFKTSPNGLSSSFTAQNDYNNADAGTYRGTYTVAVRF